MEYNWQVKVLQTKYLKYFRKVVFINLTFSPKKSKTEDADDDDVIEVDPAENENKENVDEDDDDDEVQEVTDWKYLSCIG